MAMRKKLAPGGSQLPERCVHATRRLGKTPALGKQQTFHRRPGRL